MTEQIDLCTVARLGEHFSTVEESGVVKADMVRLQRDVELIKRFLSKMYGSEFSNLFNDMEEEEEEYHTKAVKTEGVRNGESDEKPELRAPPKLQHLPKSKPPPLHRFNMSSNGSQSQPSSKLASGAGSRVGVGVGGEKVEKFHRNFLSMRSLKSSPSVKNGKGLGTPISTIANNGSLSISKIAIPKKPRNGNISVKLEPPRPQHFAGYGRSHVQYEADADFNGGNEENYNEVYETGEIEEEYDYYGADPQYEENADINGDYDEVEDNPIPQGYDQPDDTIYEENYDDELDDLDMAGANYYQHLPPSSLITTMGASQAIPKKANGRRVSNPVPSSSQTNEDSNDKDSPKSCKVCHKEVSSFDLFSHVINFHYKGEVPTCRICQKTFTYRQGLISHMRYHDAGKYDKACSYCGKRFIRRSDVIIHERRLHTGERPYLCPVPNCNQGFVRRYCLLTHVKTNHGEPYMTQIKAQTNRRKSS